MLSHRVVAAIVLSLGTASAASAQIVGHSPGPRTRYEWNTNRPYSGGWSSGNYGHHHHHHGGGFSIGFGIGNPWGYNYYAPYGYGGAVIVPPYGYYGNGYTVIPPSSATYGYVPSPIFTAPFPPTINPPVDPLEAVEELEERFSERNRDRPIPKADRLPVLKPSTPEQQQRSLRHMATADQQFRIGHYAGAALEYRRGIADAEDLPDNYFGLGFALAAQRRYEEAVQQWKYGLMLDSTWPSRGQSLTARFGENNQFEKSKLLNRAADYVRLDPRDPERIFLLGVLVYFDGDHANARTLFESATRVAGQESHLTAFLDASHQNPANAPAGDAAPPANTPPADSDPQGSNENRSSIPAPPPANVNRPRSSVPPGSLSPDDARPIPKRQESAPPVEENGATEKFPDLQAPKLPPADV